MHHFLLAGLIVYAELAATLRGLDEHPEVRERLHAEVLANAPSGPIGPAQLRAMPYLMQVVDEVKRTCPNLTMDFGRTKRAIDVAGYTVPQGALVMMAIHESGLDSIYTAPETFDPERFSPKRDEKKRAPDAFMPQGAGALTFHKCAGYDFATVMMHSILSPWRWTPSGPARQTQAQSWSPARRTIVRCPERQFPARRLPNRTAARGSLHRGGAVNWVRNVAPTRNATPLIPRGRGAHYGGAAPRPNDFEAQPRGHTP